MLDYRPWWWLCWQRVQPSLPTSPNRCQSLRWLWRLCLLYLAARGVFLPCVFALFVCSSRFFKSQIFEKGYDLTIAPCFFFLFFCHRCRGRRHLLRRLLLLSLFLLIVVILPCLSEVFPMCCLLPLQNKSTNAPHRSVSNNPTYAGLFNVAHVHVWSP